ncbi:5'-methylthioadenosine/S-adenosylhomocysteine nucleosidase [Coraliomargarita parva]|uniref:5'-methylthioadenosine/S-adenosylhomocysteine nucleosidase family protein n=1 Tax=Coraliomargarita parva TaxID=3014050 RepID=UPI0022B33DD4|nr:5'-methylthioadenosine/S-adenosylhomocysteine nucleosidase [Coraliomargarita parva]
MSQKKHPFLAKVVFAGVFVCLAGCATRTASYGPKSFDEPGYTAVVVAYAPEMKGVLDTIEALPDAEITDERVYKGVKFKLGTYKGEPILVYATGMSIANAAMSMQMAFDYFPVKQVVYMGIAGAVNPELHPGDVVVPERWYYHDESVYSNPDPENPGEYILPDYYRAFLQEQPARKAADPNYPDYKPFEFVHPDEVLVIKEGMEKPQDTAYFSATPRLLEAAERAIGKVPPQMVLKEREAKLYVGGNGVTGSIFQDNRAYRKWEREVFNAEVTEMESAAVGQVCYINDVDWVIIRAISDLAGGQEGVNVENVYDVPASIVGARLLFALLDELAVE